MSELDKANVVQEERVEKAPRKRGCVGHCLKFWWAYLLAIVVIVVIVVPVVLLVAVPKIAQSKLDEAELTLDGLVVSNTKTDNMTIALNTTIRTDGSVHATIEAFLGDMYLEDKEPHVPFATLQFPETTADAFQTVNISQFLPIESLPALTDFNTWLLANESFRVTVKGDTYVRVKGIARRYPVTFKKTVTLAGLQTFKGTYVTDTKIALPSTGPVFTGIAHIPNRSVVTFELGNATFYNYLLGQDVGEVYLDNVILRPGNDNHFFLNSTIQQNPVISALQEKPYCDTTKGVIPFQLRGKTVFNHGQSLPYFADALGATNQTIDLDVGGTLFNSTGLKFNCSST
ncbi:hypothetical protein B0T24DRAFT_369576 [Lasiosphaeria ovina]|uniref:Uncharacterized protein n=1 Tax=Lasiosphaeria ovina TaxID=92902 RepID=A0AAE0JYS1_9PEZI|nr:hypothetical protein B0T24DRAFT_369576 [Lasiosphaeria ovina]